MIGWTPDGEVVELLPWQEAAVRAFFAWDRGQGDLVIEQRGRGAGKSVVVATVARYATDPELRKTAGL